MDTQDILFWTGAALMVASMAVPDKIKVWLIALTWWVYSTGAALILAALWASNAHLFDKIGSTSVFAACFAAAYGVHWFRERKNRGKSEVHQGQDDGGAPEEAGDPAQ